MKAEIIQSLTNDFESYARQTESGVEFWLARDLQHLLGYTDWRNFLQVVNRAKVACEVSEHRILDHFVDANKMASLRSGSQREVSDMMEKEGTTDGRDKNDLPNYSGARGSRDACHRGGILVVSLKRQKSNKRWQNHRSIISNP